jgi:hypothetical protein
MAQDKTTKLAPERLRYKSKKSGSPFDAQSSINSLSCLKCGKHKPRAEGSFKRLLGQSMFVCADCSATKTPSLTGDKK